MVSNIFYFHPYLGKIPILINIFQLGWIHQPDLITGQQIQSSNISFSSTFKKRNNLEIDWMIFAKNDRLYVYFCFNKGDCPGNEHIPAQDMFEDHVPFFVYVSSGSALQGKY